MTRGEMLRIPFAVHSKARTGTNGAQALPPFAEGVARDFGVSKSHVLRDAEGDYSKTSHGHAEI